MPIAALIPLVEAAITFLVDHAIPRIQEAFRSGEVSLEDQQRLKDRINQLKESNFAFTRPEGT
jgi:hypothetical protein